MRKHLAILSKTAIKRIFSGQKTIETRFSKHRIPPFGLISKGDLVYMKPPGEDIIGQFHVKKVFSYEGLTPTDVKKIFAEYREQISFGNIEEDKVYEKQKQDSHYGTLIFVDSSEQFITSPVRIKKSDMRGWMTLD
jgi:predicted transcriptional regulator